VSRLGRPLFVAEVKTMSPFGFRAPESWEERFALAHQHGDLISVHTDARWGGSLDLVRKAKASTWKRILAKGLHTTDEEVQAAFDAGADYATVVGRWHDDDRVWVEPRSIPQLVDFVVLHKPHLDRVIIWNQRDLNTGEQRLHENIAQARSYWNGDLCQASFIRRPEEVSPQASLFIVGEHLPEFVTHHTPSPSALAALQRPSNYPQLSAEAQWMVDKRLGILDWDGN